MKTPYYLFDEESLRNRIKAIQSISNGSWNLCYSIKANPFLLDSMMDLVNQFEVCSPGEMKICMNRKVPSEKILMSGVNKTVEDIQEAYDCGVRLYSLESKIHYSRLEEVLKDKQDSVNVYLRLSSGSQFGMDEEDVRELLQRKHPLIQVIGIHYFVGTQRKNIHHQQEELAKIEQKVSQWESEFGMSLALEYGPGLAVSLFQPDSQEPSFEELIQLHSTLVEIHRPITIELGRYITYQCGSYVTSVSDVKQINQQNIVILDGGIHHLNYYGQMMGMKIPEIVSSSKGPLENYCLCGSLCTTADVLVRQVALPHLEIGDTLTFKNCGAYSVTESPALFLSRNLPSIYLKQKSGTLLIRDALESSVWNTRR